MRAVSQPLDTSADDSERYVRPPSWAPLVTVGVWVLLLLCLSGSVGLATRWRSTVEAQHQRAVESTAVDVATSMTEALRRNIDFMATLRSTVANRPGMTNPQLANWLAGAGALRRYPGGVGFGFVAQVPAGELAAFQRRVAADPAPIAHPSPLIPAGPRSYYCLLRIGVSNSPVRVPLGLDLCAGAPPGVSTVSPAAGLHAAADSGEFTVQVLDATAGLYGINAPVYRGGSIPGTRAARRATLMGWALGSFDGPAIIAAGGGVHPGRRVEILHQNPGQLPVVLASAGNATGTSVREVPIAGDRAWTVRISGAPTTAGLSAEGQFRVVLGAGLLISALLFGFVWVLARSRRRALRLVERKTDQLRHQALHDGLTGLPNRVLILDRITGALARCRRRDAAIALLFLDLDGFKAVNDTLGHTAGDQLLRGAAARLTDVLRTSDTVGRFGGDEFVVLVEGDPLDVDRVAERIRQALAEPFHLGSDGGVTARIGVSIGIATGQRTTADELLRDADLALYEAKGSGKNRCVRYTPQIQATAHHRLKQATAPTIQPTPTT